MSDTIQAQIERAWEQHEADKALIAAYVPEADRLSWDEALSLAYERNKEAAQALMDSDESETPEERERRYMKELGFG